MVEPRTRSPSARGHDRPSCEPASGGLHQQSLLALQLEEALGLGGVHPEINGPVLVRQAEPGVIGHVRAAPRLRATGVLARTRPASSQGRSFQRPQYCGHGDTIGHPARSARAGTAPCIGRIKSNRLHPGESTCHAPPLRKCLPRREYRSRVREPVSEHSQSANPLVTAATAQGDAQADPLLEVLAGLGERPHAT